MLDGLAADKANLENVKAGFTNETCGSGGIVSLSLNGRGDEWRKRMDTYTGQIARWRDNRSWDGPVVFAVRDVSMESFQIFDERLIRAMLPEHTDITGVLYIQDWETVPVWIPNPRASFNEDISRDLDNISS